MKSKNVRQPKRDANNVGVVNHLFFIMNKAPAKRYYGFAGVIFFVLALLWFPFFQIPPFFATCLHAQDLPNNGIRGLVLVIPVSGEIDSGLSFFLQRMIRRGERENIAALVLEINSNGGLVTAAQEMKDALLKTSIPTVAYIKGRALSAAALVAISCHKIVMEPGSEMGAATPIMLMGSSVQAAEAKFVSAFRTEFESAAEARHRPRNLAGAMVDKDHESIPGLIKRGEILTFTPESASSHGYCDHIVTSIESAFRQLSINPLPLERIEPTSGETLARWMTNPNVSVILFTAGFWAIILELLVFGWGILGWVGIVLLGLFFGGHLFAYLAGFEAVLLFVIGASLLLLEILVIPGFGLTGVLGILAVCASIIIVFGGIYTALHAIAKITTLSMVFLVSLFWLAPKLKLFDRFILKEEMTTEAGFVAVDLNEYDHLLNLEGITVSPLRPSGIVRVGSERFEVVSDGEYVERNVRVTIIAVEGQKIVVRALNS
ncbi:MAG: nodulation protein NfeD [Candidatus Riflebacteria bacterium]|nr:nodulation protein NfeD [Candidatus Riflebacteria bacterium]